MRETGHVCERVFVTALDQLVRVVCMCMTCAGTTCLFLLTSEQLGAPESRCAVRDGRDIEPFVAMWVSSMSFIVARVLVKPEHGFQLETASMLLDAASTVGVYVFACLVATRCSSNKSDFDTFTQTCVFVTTGVVFVRLLWYLYELDHARTMNRQP